MQTAIEMHPHRQPRLLSPPRHPLPRLKPCLPTSLPLAAAITSWWVIAIPAGSRFLDLQQAQLSRALLASFATSGVPEELSSDGGPEFRAGCTEAFFRLWGVRHRVSLAHFLQSNGRAEVAVKSAKHLLMSNTSPTDSLDHDRFLRAMLQLRKTPDPDCNISPAQIVFGRPLRDTLSFVNRLGKFSNHNVRPLWRQAWAAKEGPLRSWISRTTESLKEHSRPLALGERVFIQNQQGTSPNKWDRSGIVVESSGHDQYRVKVDASGRLTSRNRRFLRVYTPATPSIELIPMVPHSSPTTVHASVPPPPPPRGSRPPSIDAPTTLPGKPPSSIPSPGTKRRVLGRPYSTLFRHCTDLGTSSNPGNGTRAFVNPTPVVNVGHRNVLNLRPFTYLSL